MSGSRPGQAGQANSVDSGQGVEQANNQGGRQGDMGTNKDININVTHGDRPQTNLFVPVAASVHQGSPAPIVTLVDVGALSDELLHLLCTTQRNVDREYPQRATEAMRKAGKDGWLL